MTTPAVTSSSAAAAAAAAQQTTTSKSATDGLGKDAFLKLLVAQLKYQNPMSPADGTQFIAQTAQFTMVETLQELQKSMAQLLTNEQSAVSAGYIGRQVTGVDASGKAVEGIVTGVRTDSSGPVLKVGSTELPLSLVREVTTPSSATKS